MLRLISYSLSLTVILVSLLYCFYYPIEYKFLEVGSIVRGTFELLVTFLFIEEDYIYRLPYWTEFVFNVVILTPIIFGLLMTGAEINEWLRNKRKKFHGRK